MVPKEGRKGSIAKSYTLISITSFLINTLEKIINRHFSETNNICQALLAKGVPNQLISLVKSAMRFRTIDSGSQTTVVNDLLQWQAVI